MYIFSSTSLPFLLTVLKHTIIKNTLPWNQNKLDCKLKYYLLRYSVDFCIFPSTYQDMNRLCIINLCMSVFQAPPRWTTSTSVPSTVATSVDRSVWTRSVVTAASVTQGLPYTLMEAPALKINVRVFLIH